jgi:hypothetical protein
MYKEFKSRYPNFDAVAEQCKQLVDLHGDFDNRPDGQVSIQTDDPSIDNWYAGTGQSQAKTNQWEHNFCHIQPSLRGTAIEDYIKWLAVPVYRTRIMLSKPKGCYSIHRDYSPRLHLPLVTNKQCNFLLTDPLQMFHLPADGTTTWVDTRRPHTFMNGSTEKRLHLVMIVKE